MSTPEPSAAGGRTKVTRRSGGILTEISGRAGGLGPKSTPANTGAAAPGPPPPPAGLHRARRQPREVLEAEQPPLVAEREPDRVAVDEHVGGVRVALGERQ